MLITDGDEKYKKLLEIWIIMAFLEGNLEPIKILIIVGNAIPETVFTKIYQSVGLYVKWGLLNQYL